MNEERLRKYCDLIINELNCLGNFPQKEIEKNLGITGGNVTKCCKGKRKTAGGYKWRYSYAD